MSFRAQPKATIVQKFICDESGSSTVEYGLVAAGLSVAIISVLRHIGADLVAVFAD